jgi:glycosyltransferase involved in cell wall biosynthesis
VRVLAISNLYPPDVCGGYELGCRQSVDALRARGHDVRVLTSAPRLPADTPPHVLRSLQLTDLWDYYSETHSAPVTLRLKETEALQINAFNVHALLGVLDGFRPDVAYLWMLAGVGGLGLLACLHHLSIPWVWHLMDEVPAKLCQVFDQVQPGLASVFSRQFRGTFLACSRQLVDEIERRGVSLGGQVELMPNWVTGPRPSPRPPYDREGTLRIVAASALLDRHYDKGIDLLIQSLHLLRTRSFDRFSLDIYGNVTDSFYADLARSLDLDGRVRLMGSLDQSALVEAYANYDVFAFPGRPREPFGFAPLEASARGCVPVMNCACGASEWLVHGVHCLKAARSAEAFADALEQVLDGTVALESMARMGETAIWRDFHIDALFPRIERALQAAAARPRARAGSAREAYRLAVLAEKLCSILVQDSFCA